MPVLAGFVNRETEITAITELIQTLDRPIPALAADTLLPRCIVNLYGPPGSGKSMLLRQLRALLCERTAVLLIDLRAPFRQDNLRHEKLRFLHTALEQLEQLAPPPDVGPIQEQLARAEGSPDDEPLESARDALVALLQRRAEQQIVLLCIDSCEHASEAFFAWLERFVLLPLIHDAGGQARRVIGVFASQMQLRWRQHNVRRRVEAQPLGPLSLAATQQQVGDVELGRAIYAFTFGHALSNRVAIDYLQAQPIAPLGQGAWLTDNDRELIAAVVRNVREHAATSMLAGAALPEGWEQWDLWQIIEPLAVLREFDVHSMRAVLQAYDERFSRISQSDLLIIIRELLKTRLVEWNNALRAYQIAPAIRQIFARSLELRQPASYTRLRDVAIQYYAEQIRTVPSNRNLYLIEHAFQQLNDPALASAAAQPLTTQFADFLKAYYQNAAGTYRDDESLVALERALDADTELQQAFQGRGLPPDLLSSAVRRFRGEV